MESRTPELGPDAFRLARQAARADRSEQVRRDRARVLAALHSARDAFRDHAGDGADPDGDTLEILADHLVDWVRTLERDLDRLGPARDRTAWRGPILTRQRAPVDVGALAEAVAEVICENILSTQAGAVLTAAVRRLAS